MNSITLKDFSFSYLHQEGKALSKINLEVSEGSIVGIIGRAGAGKSTLVKSLNGLVPRVELGYQDGDVVVAGLNTRDNEVNQMARKVGIVLQNPEIQIFSLTVTDDIAFGPANLGVPREEIYRRVANALRDAELEPLAASNPNDISGGEQQSLAIAGILAMEPSVMAFDEPVSMLDPLGKQQVMNIMQQVAHRNNTTSITTESGADIESIAEVVDRLVAIDQGGIVLDGKPSEVLENPITFDIGVGRPQVTELFIKLRQKGHEFQSVPISLESAYAMLCGKLKDLGITRITRPPQYKTTTDRVFGQTAVEVENLHHFYKPRVHALKGVSLTIPERQI